MSAVWLPQPGAEVACVAKILLHPIVQSAKMGHNYTLLLHLRSLEENIRCFNISIAAWIIKSSFNEFDAFKNKFCLSKERETEKRRAATDSAQEPELRWSTARIVSAVNYWPLPFSC